jgi:hypothetical protein
VGATGCNGCENGLILSGAMSGKMVKVARKMVVLGKWVSVWCGRQVSWLTDRPSSNKWQTDHLECEMAGDGD